MEIRVLSAGAVESGMEKFAQHVQQQTGHVLKIQFNTAPQITKRLADGEVYDMLVSPLAVMDRAAKDGLIFSDTRVPVGRVGVGVVVRDDAEVPDISTEDKLKQAVLAADSIVCNQASTGQYMETLFERMGIADVLKPKTMRFPNGASVLEQVIKGQGKEIGFAAMTEIKQYEGRGLKMVGTLPTAIQNWTAYEAVRMKGQVEPAIVDAVLKMMASPAGKAAFASGGIQ